jgi:2-methylaconitate cis-trans-isomerase PrpF
MPMRGGTSKGACFLASDLPSDAGARARVLLDVMGSPDPRQIDGVGGAHPLTSKVAVVSRSERPGVDPTGEFTVRLEVGGSEAAPVVERAGLLRTARALFDGIVFLKASAWLSAQDAEKRATAVAAE